MKSRNYILVCCFVLLTVFVSIIWLRSKENFDIVPVLEGEDKAQYILHRSALVPREDITSFIVDNGKMYILYDNAALVNVYGTDGIFRYGIQISTMKNGHADIAVIDGTLYIYSRRSIIFSFQETQLIDTVDPHSDQEKYLSTRNLFLAEKKTSDEINKYEISESRNTIVNKNTQKTVIDLPQKSKAADYLTIIGLLLLFFVFHGYSFMFTRRQH